MLCGVDIMIGDVKAKEAALGKILDGGGAKIERERERVRKSERERQRCEQLQWLWRSSEQCCT